MRPVSHLLALPLALLPTLALAATDLSVEVTRPVDCTRKSKNGDKLAMNYKGTLEKDGSQFDSSYDRGRPFNFKLGAGQVIAGWDQGLTDMCPGEGRKLVIPPGLAYGNDAKGSIPAGSTLVFEVELVEIVGVKPEPKPSPSPAETSEASKPTQVEDIAAASHAVADVASATAALSAAMGTPGAQSSPLDGEKGDDECNLLGDFALLVQAALGLLAVSSLAVKRWREHPRRPVKIWFFDASKQVFGSVLLHGANVLMSMLSSGKFDVAAKTSVPAGEEGDQPNPCSFYLLNLAIDTTIGIPILVLLLKVLYRGALLTPLANPPESIRSGNYGQPPRATWWLKQSVIYFCGLLLMKLCVLAIFAFLPWIAWVGDWALRWTEGNTAVQITFVMFIFPLIMNALQYWIIDNFIKDPEHGGEGGYEGVGDSDEDEESDDEWLERQQRRREQGIDDEDEDVEAVAIKPLNEANPTPVPVRSKDYDPEIDGAASRK